MWVCRAGRSGKYYSKCIQQSKLYLVWDGFSSDLSLLNNMDQFRGLVAEIMCTTNKTSISNWAGQLLAFSQKIKIGDYVLIPDRNSSFYIYAKVIGPYTFDKDNIEELFHSRSIEILASNIPKSIFDIKTQYSLRAYRTVYQVKREEEIIQLINNWIDATRR